MNAASPIIDAGEALSRRRDDLRGHIAEMLWGCGIYCNTGLSFIELEDDAALEYSIRQIIARVKVARDVMSMLKATREVELADAA